jgi:phage gpG-like protein
MSIGLSIRVRDNNVASAFKRLMRFGGDQRQVLGRLGLFMRRDAQRRLRRRPKDWGPSSTRLSKSLAMRLDRYSVTVGSNLVYAAIQQLGGTVVPRRVYLAIPVDPQIRRRGTWPRDLPQDSLKFVRAANIRIGSHSWTGPALVRARGDETETPADGAGVADGTPRRRRRPVRRAGEVLFALVKRVNIRGRPYLVFDEIAKAFLLQQVTLAARMAWKGK